MLLFGCASKYRPVNPRDIVYGTKAEKSDVDLYYRYDVMSSQNNVKQIAKELRKDIKIVAIKIYNNTPRSIIVGKNARFYADGKELSPMATDDVKKEMKQSIPSYLPYLLLSPIKFSYDKDNGNKTVEIFGGAIIGGALAAGNIYKAAKANNKLKKELDDYSLWNKEILPGETVYGIIGLQKTGYVALELKLVN